MKTTSITVPLICSAFLLAGCAATRTVEKTANGAPVYIDQIPEAQKQSLRGNIAKGLNDGLASYRFTSGDEIEVVYHVAPVTEVKEYTLGVKDEIELEFSYHPKLNRTVTIRPDGQITLPGKGDIMAAGLTPTGLASAIVAAYKDSLQNPTVTVSVKTFSSRIDLLKNALVARDGGAQARLAPVTPGGNVYLPLLPEIRASGRTVGELQDEINRKYQDEFRNLKVSVLVKSIAGSRLFVFGEVQKPGAIMTAKPMTVLQAIAQAGGALPTGSLDHVKVLYWPDATEARVRTVNLFNVINDSKLEEDILLPGNSVVFVPMTTIARMDKAVEQYIKGLFMYNGASLGFFYDLRGESLR